MKTKDLCQIAIFASLISICSWLTIPSVVPFTLQTLGVFLAILILGEKKGLITILIYLLIGLIGIPVFSNFTGGIGIILGPTGGYLIGFIFIDLTFWVITHFFGKNQKTIFLSLFIGIIICYTIGTIWFVGIKLIQGNEISLLNVLSICVFPFILPDILKIIISIIIYLRINEIICDK